MTMTKPTSEQVTFTAAGSGATLRNLVDKVREVVSVKDFGAVGDGVADDTAAIQAAIDAAQAQNRALYMPSGIYRVSSVTYTLGPVPTNGILIYGDSPGNTYGTRGTRIQSIGTSGSTFIVDGVAGNAAFLEIRNITFSGNSQVDAGLELDTAWFVKLVDCAFTGFTKAGARGLWFYANDYSGTSEVRGCRFGSNSIGILVNGDTNAPPIQTNVLAYNTCYFLDHTEAAVRIGDVTTQLTAAFSHNFSTCGFEGNARDIVSNVSNYQIAIQGCYFELVGGSPYLANPRIDIVRSGASAPASVITICNNTFVAPLPSAGTSLVVADGDFVTVRSNFSNAGNAADRFFLTSQYAPMARIEPPASPPGITPYPIRYRIGETFNTFTHAIDTATRPTIVAVPYSSNIIVNIASVGIRTITPTDGNSFSISAVGEPYGMPQLFTICIINTTGGSLGAVTWFPGVAGFKIGAAWTQPATGHRRYITFLYDPAANVCYEVSRSTADVPN